MKGTEINWVSRISGVTENLLAVTFGDGLFVAVGNKGTIVTSVDGIVWEVRTSGIIDDFLDVAYGNGIFVAVGNNGSILTSGD